MPTNHTGAAMSLTQQVAEEIRVMMTRRRMTGAALAKALDVSASWVSYRLNGQVAFDLNDLERIAKILDCRIIDLLPSGGGAATREKRPATERPTDNRPNGRAEARNVRRPRRVTSPLPAPSMLVMSGV